MEIYGLQKLTLLDYPGHTACTVFLGGCNMRCPFCHNFGLVDGSAHPVMEEKELFSFLKKRQGLLDGVAITGGEPLLSSDLLQLMDQIKRMGFLVKLDTNGLLPEKLEQILDEDLVDYIAMDIKNSPAKYAMTAGLKSIEIERIKKSIAIIISKAKNYEFRTTVVAEYHDEQDMVQIGELIQGAARYFIQSFQNSDRVPDQHLSPHMPQKLEDFRKIVSDYVEQVTIRGIE